MRNKLLAITILLALLTAAGAKVGSVVTNLSEDLASRNVAAISVAQK